MSDDESINSDEIPSDRSSESSIENEEKEDKALSNLKTTLNLDNNSNLKTNVQDDKKTKQNKNKIYFLENNTLKESEKNVQTTKSQKIDFSDVFKTFQSDIKNETSRANLSRAVKNFGISQNNEDVTEDKKEKSQNIKNKPDINIIKKNYKEQKEEKKLERETSYLEVGNQVTGYQAKVKSLREADVVDFTQDDSKKVRHIGQKSLKEIAASGINKSKKDKKKDDMNSKINKILVENNCISDDKILEQETKELMNINPEELKRRYEELKQIRARLFQKEIENKRKAKIKSKLYHKIKKNKKIKEENDLLEQLAKIDPESVKKYEEKFINDRVQERMQLKHSLNSKFQKTIKKYHFDKDQQVKEAIKDNFQLRDKLLRKIEGKENDDEYEENEEEEENEVEEKFLEGINEENGEKNIIMNFDEKKEENNNNKNAVEKNDKMAVFSMPFMKNAEENLDIQEKMEKLKNKFNNVDELDDYDKIEKDNDNDNDDIESNNEYQEKQNNNKRENKSNKKNQKQKAPTITKDTLKKINEDTKKINNNNENNKKIDVKFDADTLQQMINEENIKEDINNFNNFLIENDINKKEFLENENKEQLDEIKKNNPEFMPGWGLWAGDDKEIKAKEFLRKKRYEEKIKRLKEQANETKDNKFVKISNQIDHNYSEFLVKELPQDMGNRKQFEKYNKTLIGREVNSLNIYKKLIQPKVVKKIGQIINPMTANDSTKGMKLQEIIEKVTRKKKFTKAKL